MSAHFPFAAIVGPDDMKLAMLLTAIDGTIGGVLVFGDRGTGKSTAVRALTECGRHGAKRLGCHKSIGFIER